RGGSLEDLARLEPKDPFAFREYEHALGRLKDDCLNRGFAEGEARPFTWPELLQWFARDQETRFQDIATFRSKRSGTSNPIDAAKGDLLLRTAVGLGDAEEARAAEKLDQARQELEGAKAANREAERMLETSARVLGAELEGSGVVPRSTKVLEKKDDLF